MRYPDKNANFWKYFIKCIKTPHKKFISFDPRIQLLKVPYKEIIKNANKNVQRYYFNRKEIKNSINAQQ